MQIADSAESDLSRAFSLYKNFDVEASVRDLLATLAHVRRMKGCNGKVGVVGYCLGGRLAWLMASRSDVDCSVSYYGVGLDQMLDELYEIRMPLLLHVAEKDRFVSPSQQTKILSCIQRNPAVTAHVYPGAEHGFARPGGQAYRADAAELATSRTLKFLSEALKG